MNKLLADIIMICHIIIILFVIIIPFTNSNYFLLIHAIIIPFIMLHWILNNNTCALTIFEKILRTKDGVVPNSEDCFTCRLIEPIYDFKNNYDDFSTLIYIITTGLWLISAYKLFNKYRCGEITSIDDLMKIKI